MNCGRCGKEATEGPAFCANCGASLQPTAARRLFRVPSRGRLAGVCAGIAMYFDTDVTLVRLAWIVLSIVPGGILGGVLAYIAAALLMPVSTAAVPARSHELRRSASDRKLGGVCGGLAEYFSVDATLVRVAAVVLATVPGAIICGVLAYLVAWFIMPDEHVTPMVATPHAAG